MRYLYPLAGPTAVGKSAVALQLAEKMGLDILSVDSMQVYKGLDIGTAKPSKEEQQQVRHWGIDLVLPHRSFNVGAYLDAIKHIPGEKPLLAVGGSGLYFSGLFRGVGHAGEDAELREELESLYAQEGLEALHQRLTRAGGDMPQDPNNPRRVIRAIERMERGEEKACWETTKPALVALTMERQALRERIRKRANAMWEQGLLEETEQALKVGLSETAKQAIGYAEMSAYIRGECSKDEALENMVVRTHRLAKKQITWFKHQADTTWVAVDELSVRTVAEKVLAWFENIEPSPCTSMA